MWLWVVQIVEVVKAVQVVETAKFVEVVKIVYHRDQKSEIRDRL